LRDGLALLVAGRTSAPSLRGATISMLPAALVARARPLAAVRPEALVDARPSLFVGGRGARAEEPSRRRPAGLPDLEAVARGTSPAPIPKGRGRGPTPSPPSPRHLDAARAASGGRSVPAIGGALTATIVARALARGGQRQR
jgi:hypothetical protein